MKRYDDSPDISVKDNRAITCAMLMVLGVVGIVVLIVVVLGIASYYFVTEGVAW